jgi:hypothetical protein
MEHTVQVTGHTYTEVRAQVFADGELVGLCVFRWTADLGWHAERYDHSVNALCDLDLVDAAMYDAIEALGKDY